MCCRQHVGMPLTPVVVRRCPACQHFAPHYEKVAAFFHGSPRPKPEVYVARVDCATEVRALNGSTTINRCCILPSMHA